MKDEDDLDEAYMHFRVGLAQPSALSVQRNTLAFIRTLLWYSCALAVNRVRWWRIERRVMAERPRDKATVSWKMLVRGIPLYEVQRRLERLDFSDDYGNAEAARKADIIK